MDLFILGTVDWSEQPDPWDAAAEVNEALAGSGYRIVTAPSKSKATEEWYLTSRVD